MQKKLTDAAFEEISSKIKALNKRAQKLGLPEMSIRKLSTEYKKGPNNYWQEIHTVEILGEVPKIAGWNVLAAIEHNYCDGQYFNVIHSRQDAPEPWYSIAPNCAHCNSDRPRKKTFMLQDDTGQVKQVGSTCLKDFTRAPLAMFGYAEDVIDWIDYIEYHIMKVRKFHQYDRLFEETPLWKYYLSLLFYKVS